MKQVVAAVLLGVLLVGLAPSPARAGVAGDVALGLASFLVFTSVVGALASRPVYAAPAVVYPAPVYLPPPVYYSSPVVYSPPVYYSTPVTYATPAVTVVQPATPRVVRYPHGRYELRGDGVTTAYQWVWIPAVPPPPPPPPPAAPPPGSAPPPPPGR
jgi:hypothetical protein